MYVCKYVHVCSVSPGCEEKESGGSAHNCPTGLGQEDTPGPGRATWLSEKSFESGVLRHLKASLAAEKSPVLSGCIMYRLMHS